MSADDKSKRARQWPISFFTPFVSFSEKETAPKSVSHYYTHIKEEMLKKATVDLEGVFKKRAGME